MIAKYRTAAGLLLVLALTCLAYSPGLSGGFLFDDFVNLNAIGATGPVDNWEAFFRYVTSGTADPTGRPLALLSFLVDARDWPADPAPFLRTNLILHLLNGSLLFMLLRALGQHLGPGRQQNDAAALLGSAFWLLHPLFVSTTLYVVQREAMLPATLFLLGLLAYLRGRRIYVQGDRNSGLCWMVGGIAGGTFLAVLCKGNGALLPLLTWVLEATILRRGEPSPADVSLRRIRLVLLVLPSLALAVFLGSFLPSLNVTLDQRGWSIGQRLLTESRVVTDYLQLLIVPRSVSTGLYNDAYQISTGPFRPATTLPSLLLIVSLGVLAWRVRSRAPSLSAALLFFLAGHLMESTVIPLELYFEHRNYVPALLLFWPMARGITGLRFSVPLRTGIGTGLLLFLAITTFQRAQLWGNPGQLAALWALQSPSSSRAQATAAMLDTSAGKPELALSRLGPLWKQHHGDLQIAFNYVNAACASGGLSAKDSAALESALRVSETGLRLANGWLSQAIELADSGQCPGLGLGETARWLSAVGQNAAMRRTGLFSEDIEPLLAQLAISRREPDLALVHFDRALAAFVTPDAAARQASTLARNGYYRQALAHLDTYAALQDYARPPGPGMPWIHAFVLRRQGYWPREMAALRTKLKGELGAPRVKDAAIESGQP